MLAIPLMITMRGTSLLATEVLCQVVKEVLLLVEEYLSKDPIIQLAVMRGYFLVCVLLVEMPPTTWYTWVTLSTVPVVWR